MNTRTPNRLIPADLPTMPGPDLPEAISVSVGSPADDADAIGYLVFTDADVPAGLGLDRDALVRAGFEAKAGSSLLAPTSSGPEIIAVGAGALAEFTAVTLRDAAAALGRAATTRPRFAFVVESVGSLSGGAAAQAITEGAVLARYKYTATKPTNKHVPLQSLTIELPDADGADAGITAGLLAARATVVARDLTNTPPGHLTATNIGEISVALGERFGFEVELFDKAALIELGCGGLLGVNRGSTEEPRMVKLTYRPDGESTGHLGLIGKGIMYDSGGISLKPSDAMHLLMKMDMGGAAAVLGAVAAMRDRGVTATVTGWLMCTDNMPSGDSYKLGDVLVSRNGTTIEVKNTDAEGRLVMSDAFGLANEAGVDAIIDIATLTGAALMAFGVNRAPVYSNNDALADAVLAASAAVDEPLWRMPLERKYRPQLDSEIADISNLGGPYAGATTAALFLDHFAGTTPWAHLDIAGTMQTDKDDSYRTAGATGFGARILLETAAAFAG